MMIPVIVGELLGYSSLGIVAGISALLVSIGDSPGAYRVRAFVLMVAIAGVAAMFTISPIVAESIWLAVLATVTVTFAGAFLGIFGSAATKVGMATSVALVVGLTVVSAETSISERFLAAAAGGLLAAGLALLAWPFRPFEPLLNSVAEGFRNFASLITALAGFNAGTAGPDDRWQEAVKDERDTLARSIQQARSQVTGERMLRPGRNDTFDAITLLLQVQHRLALEAIALREALTGLRQESPPPDVLSRLDDEMTQVAKQAERIGAAIDTQASSPRQVKHEFALESSSSDLNRAMEHARQISSSDTGLEEAVNELRQISRNLETATHILEHTQRPLTSSVPAASISETLGVAFRRALSRIEATLTRNSLLFRHSLRMALTVGAAVAITQLLDLSQGFWIPMTVILVMKPDFGGSRRTAIDRILATLTGGMVAAVMVAFILNIYVLYALVIAAGVFAFAEIASTYRRGVAFLTVFIIALLNLTNPGDWTLAVERVLYTAAGGVLAIVAGYLLWPSWMKTVVPEKIAEAIAANRAYFNDVSAALQGRADPVRIRRSRRRAALSNSNEEVAFQRMLSEPGGQQGSVGPYYEFGVANRQFTDRVTALALHIRSAANQQPWSELESFTTAVNNAMETLESVVQAHLDHANPPDLDQALLKANRYLSQSDTASTAGDGQSRAGSDIVAAELSRLVSDLGLMARAAQSLPTESES